MAKRINGISVCNPVALDRAHLLRTADYAIAHGVTHYQFIGPIHEPETGNVDGMVLYRKYARFNNEKNAEYVRFCGEVVNEVCEKLSAAGVKTYMWHHELEVPEGFRDAYPEILNSDGDVEITHPLIRDFLENKLADFFAAYPKMDGLILTLHETRIPLLKLKNQKLDKLARVQYVTGILYDTCRALGKELVVRPFASIEEDYEMMTRAYEQISGDMVIMDKWTQFDWSLTLPVNAFFCKIKKNPLLVETDIFGEYFGLGILPIMLRSHILKNFAYCEGFEPRGYVSRIDRAGYDAFGDVNEVNYRIMEACLQERDVDEAIDAFFAQRYGAAGPAVRSLMENTEDIQRHIFNLKDYYFSEGSRFPALNHCKNHFYFEMMKAEHHLVSGEWFIPIGWERGEVSALLEEKQQAVEDSGCLLARVCSLESQLSVDDYAALLKKFLNLHCVAKLWQTLTDVFVHYARYFDEADESREAILEASLTKLLTLEREADGLLGDEFYVTKLACNRNRSYATAKEPVQQFVADVRESFRLEKELHARLTAEKLTDFVICGGGAEGHKIKKEVNFSDTYIKPDGLCRIPGTYRGKAFSTVNAHGWFSYEVRVRPDETNALTVVAAGSDGHIDFDLAIGDEKHEVRAQGEGKRSFTFTFNPGAAEAIRLRVDRVSGYTPFIYEVRVG